MTRVKLCGNRTIEDVALSVASGADALGFIVGTRFVSEDELSPQRARELLRKVPPFVATVLVTHLQAAREIVEIHGQVPTSVIQLHNDLAVEEIQAVRLRVPAVRLIKAVHVEDEGSIDAARAFAPFVDAILLDTRTRDRIGGTGRVHDWSISRRITALLDQPVVLAGGLHPGNVEQAIDFVGPFGVDVNSGVDSPSGEKEEGKIREFLVACRRSDDSWWQGRPGGGTAPFRAPARP